MKQYMFTENFVATKGYTTQTGREHQRDRTMGCFSANSATNTISFPGTATRTARQQWQQMTPQQEEYWRQQVEHQRMLNLQHQALVTLPQQQTALVPALVNGGMQYLQWPYKDSAATIANHHLIASGSGPAQPAPSSTITLEQLGRWWNDKQKADHPEGNINQETQSQRGRLRRE